MWGVTGVTLASSGSGIRGDLTAIREECRMINFKHKRASDRALLFEAAWQDLKFGVRALAKRPLFTGIAILTLSLGVGATTAVFGPPDQAHAGPVGPGR